MPHRGPSGNSPNSASLGRLPALADGPFPPHGASTPGTSANRGDAVSKGRAADLVAGIHQPDDDGPLVHDRGRCVSWPAAGYGWCKSAAAHRCSDPPPSAAHLIDPDRQ